MRKIFIFFLAGLMVLATACTSPAGTHEKPIGKGSLNLCVSDPAEADYWQNTYEVLWNYPDMRKTAENRAVVAHFPACDNVPVTIWEYQHDGNGWYRVTARTHNGNSMNGWLPADHLMQVSNESGTEWSNNYSSITGSWDQTGRENGAKIWYNFKTDGTFTFNYDMPGNKQDIQNTGSWEYLGNGTYRLISTISRVPDTHGNENITISNDGTSFYSGNEYSSASADGRAIRYAKE